MTIDRILTNTDTIYGNADITITGTLNNYYIVNINTPSGCVISVTAPALFSPIHRAYTTDTTPSFSWGSVSGAESYRVMVYTEDRSFEFKKRTFNTSYTLAAVEALSPAKYLWRVRTQDTLCTTWTSWTGRTTLFVD